MKKINDRSKEKEKKKKIKNNAMKIFITTTHD